MALDYYRQLLTYIRRSTAVTKNYADKSINSILDHVSASVTKAIGTDGLHVQQKFYELTLEALKVGSWRCEWKQKSLTLTKIIVRVKRTIGDASRK